ncbi:hypothetical protein GF337_09070, partial [candidate division KSB1 bacterium]|nr:hypothetical protein [candidate division KSB1 bacterium]
MDRLKGNYFFRSLFVLFFVTFFFLYSQSDKAIFYEHGDVAQRSNVIRSESADNLNIRLISQIHGGPCEAVAIDENIAFFGNGNVLEIVDFTNPATPVELSNLILPHYISGILYQDDVLYVSASYGGLRIIDVSDLSDPAEIGCFKNDFRFHSLEIMGEYALCANGFSGLIVLNISDPAEPVVAAHLTDVGLAFDIKINGNFAFIPGRYYGFYVVDISNPTMPQLYKHIDPGYYFEKLDVTDDYAFISCGGNGVIVLDIKQPDLLPEIVTIPTYSANDVLVEEDFLYVADDTDGLKVFDISTVTAPVQIGEYDNRGRSEEIQKSGDIVYIGDYHEGVRLVDVTTKSSPVEIGSFDTRGETTGIAADGSYMYTVEREKGLRVFDISDIHNPAEIGFCELKDPVDIQLRDHYAFIADDFNGFRVIDISDPYHPADVAGITLGSAYDIALHDRYAFVGNMNNGLTIVDIQDPLNPIKIGNYENDGYSFTVDIVANCAYVANGNQGLRVYNIADPYNPEEIFQYKLDRCYFRDVKINNGYAYVADMNKNVVRIFDISAPMTPIEVALFDDTDTPFSILVHNNFAYIGEHQFGVKVLDLSNPTAPVITGRYENVHRTERLALANGFIFLTNYQSGALILDYQEVDPLAPNAPDSLRAVQLTDQIHLTWNDISDDETGFFVEMHERRSGWTIADTVQANMTSIQLDTSITNERLLFRLAAYNEHGRSAYSNTDTLDTINLTEWIEIRSPNGGEIWEFGSEHQLMWQTSSAAVISTITVELSIDGGSTWISPHLMTGISNTGSATWIIPYTLSDNCILKISDAEDGIPYDLSNNPFSIIEGEPDIPDHWTFTDRTGNSATVILPVIADPNINGTPLHPGYYIGIFAESGLCCGFRQWTSENLSLTVWGDNEMTPEIDGLQTGETLYYRVFNPIDSLEYTNVNIAYSQGDGLYTANTIMVLSQFEINSTGINSASSDKNAPSKFELYPN